LPQNFAWQGLFENQLEPLVFKSAGLAGMEQAKIKARPFSPQTNTVYNFSLDENYLPAVVSAKDKILLVVPKATEVLKMLQNKIADAVVFMPQQKFDANKLKEFLNRKDLKAEEVKFLLKVLVWQHTNWQTDTLLDLNLSFFGGQFKNLISGGEIKENKTAHTVACDLSAFLYLSENQLYKNRKVVICGLSEFETAVTTNIAAKSSWGYINYMLKSFYNPELNLGEQKYKETTEAALLAGDLFFGLTNALFQTTPASFQYVKINDYIRSEEKYLKIAAAAETYIEKLSASNQILLSKEVEKFVYDLKNFFAQEENRVKWIELAENRCAFISMPLEITGLVAKAFKPFASISFADSIEEKHLVKFFLKRLGLEAYKVESQNKQNGTKTKTVLQGDLFEKVKKVLGAKPKAVEYHCLEKPVNASDILDIVTKAKNLPAAVLFSGPLQVKDFYEQNYEQLKQKAALLTQTAYGGSNKIFRNFSIHKNALLLATDKFVLKALTSPNPVEPVSKLPVQTLILCRLPFDQFTHPYQEAVSASFPNAFEDYSLPRALYNFQSLIKFFYTPALRDIYIIDSKLSKPYARVFKDFWQVIPNATSKT